MLKIYDLYGNQLGLVVGEYQRELLVLLGTHSVEEFGSNCINFEEVERRCGKKLHCISKTQKMDQRLLRDKLNSWWIKNYPELDFSYHLSVIYHNISKRDWVGINLLKFIDEGIFTLISHRKFKPKVQIPVDRGEFPPCLGDGKYLAGIINSHPHVVTYSKTKIWDETKKDSGVYTQLSLKCGEKIINKKLPYFLQTKKGDKFLLEITDDKTVPSAFVGGMKYSYIHN